jgi:hypothetical protein
MLLDRAWGRPPQLNSNAIEYKRVIDMTDQELEAIIAQAQVPIAAAPALAAPAEQLEQQEPTATDVSRHIHVLSH